MGVSSNEKVDLASYQLKDVDQTLYNHCRDNRSLRAAIVTFEVFWRVLFYRFFPREKTGAKAEELINLRQGGMSVKEYSLKFTKLFKYACSLVFNPRDKMSRFLTEVFNDLV